jgi:hypothetical protein
MVDMLEKGNAMMASPKPAPGKTARNGAPRTITDPR